MPYYNFRIYRLFSLRPKKYDQILLYLRYYVLDVSKTIWKVGNNLIGNKNKITNNYEIRWHD